MKLIEDEMFWDLCIYYIYIDCSYFYGLILNYYIFEKILKFFFCIFEYVLVVIRIKN